MNSLTLQSQVYGAPDALALGLAALDPWTRDEVIDRAVRWGVETGVAEYVAVHGLASLGQATDVITGAVTQALQPMLPQLQTYAMQAADPILAKASDMVDEKLRTWGPIVGGIAGVVAAILGIIGMVVVGGYVVRKVA